MRFIFKLSCFFFSVGYEKMFKGKKSLLLPVLFVKHNVNDFIVVLAFKTFFLLFFKQALLCIKSRMCGYFLGVDFCWPFVLNRP